MGFFLSGIPVTLRNPHEQVSKQVRFVQQLNSGVLGPGRWGRVCLAVKELPTVYFLRAHVSQLQKQALKKNALSVLLRGEGEES